MTGAVLLLPVLHAGVTTDFWQCHQAHCLQAPACLSSHAACSPSTSTSRCTAWQQHLLCSTLPQLLRDVCCSCCNSCGCLLHPEDCCEGTYIRIVCGRQPTQLLTRLTNGVPAALVGTPAAADTLTAWLNAGRPLRPVRGGSGRAQQEH